MSPVADDRWNVEQLDRILAEQPGENVQVGDMVFRRPVLQRSATTCRQVGPPAPSAASTGVTLWTGGTVPYTFDASVSAAHQRHILDATAEWVPSPTSGSRRGRRRPTTSP